TVDHNFEIVPCWEGVLGVCQPDELVMLSNDPLSHGAFKMVDIVKNYDSNTGAIDEDIGPHDIPPFQHPVTVQNRLRGGEFKMNIGTTTDPSASPVEKIVIKSSRNFGMLCCKGSSLSFWDQLPR